MTVISGYMVDAGDWHTIESRVGRSFNITLKFTPIRHNDEVTYLTMSEGYENRRSHEDGWLVSIPIRHPAGVIIDESNWAGFLQHNVYKLGNGKWDMPQSVLHKRGFTSLEAFPSLGSYCFLIERVGMSFGVVIPRPDGTSMIYQRYPKGLIIKHPFSDRLKYKSIQFNNEGIYVQPDLAMQGMSSKRESYSAKFVTKLPPYRELQLHLDKKTALDFKIDEFTKSPDNMMAELAAATQGRTYQEIKGLVPKSFHDFSYFKSLDGSLMLTIQHDPVSKAFQALKDFAGDLIETGSSERAMRVETQYSRIMVEYVLGGIYTTNERKTLLGLIELIESDDVAAGIS